MSCRSPAAAAVCRAACRAADSARATSDRCSRADAQSGSMRTVPAGGLLATGRITATLKVAASGGESRQWVAILCLEEADGALVNLGEGATTAPADTDELTLDLGDVCVELAPGARLALLVSGGLARRFPAPATASEQRVDEAILTLTAS